MGGCIQEGFLSRKATKPVQPAGPLFPWGFPSLKSHSPGAPSAGLHESGGHGKGSEVYWCASLSALIRVRALRVDRGGAEIVRAPQGCSEASEPLEIPPAPGDPEKQQSSI